MGLDSDKLLSFFVLTYAVFPPGFSFLPCDAMHSAAIAVTPVSVRPSVRPSRSWVHVRQNE